MLCLFVNIDSYNILKAWMQKDSDKPLGAEKHLIAGAVAGEGLYCSRTTCIGILDLLLKQTGVKCDLAHTGKRTRVH